MLRTSFRVKLHSIVALNVKEPFAQNRRNIWSLSGSSTVWTHNHLVCKQSLNHLAKCASTQPFSQMGQIG